MIRINKINIWRIFSMLISIMILIWITMFISGIESLNIRIFPVMCIFFLLGYYNPKAGLILWIFTLPLFPIYVWLNNVSNFSINEIFIYSLISGMGINAAYKKIIPSIKINNTDKSLMLYFLAALLSFIIVIMQNHIILSEIFLRMLPGLLNDVFQAVSAEELAAYRIFLNLFTGIFIYFIFKNYFRENNFRIEIFGALFAGGLVACVYGYLQYVIGFNLVEFWEDQAGGLRRINSTFPDVNSAGTFFGCLTIMSWAYLSNEIRINKTTGSKFFKKEIYLFFVLFTFLILIMTGSKTNIFFTCLLLIFYTFSSQKIFKVLSEVLSGYKTIILITTGVFLAAIVLILPVIAENQKDILSFLNEDNIMNRALKGRPNLWRSAILVWSDAPVFGNGIGLILEKIIKYHNPEAFYWNPYSENAHNYYLQIGAEMGAIGLLVFILFIVNSITDSLKSISSAENDKIDYHLKKSAFFCICLYILVSFLSHPMLVRELLWLFLIFVSFLTSNEIPQTSNGNKSLILRKNFSPYVVIAIAMAAVFPVRIIDTDKERGNFTDSTGFYQWEYDDDGRPYKWSGEYSAFLIKSKIKDITFHIQNPRGEDFPVTIKVLLDKKLADTIVLDDYHWYPVHIYYPGMKYRKLELISDKSWSPKELHNPQNSPDGNQDKRRFSFRFSMKGF